MSHRVVLAALVLAVMGSPGRAQDDLPDRIAKLIEESRYDLAVAILEDHRGRGVELDAGLRWTMAKLVTDPDRFDRLTSELVGGQSAEDPAVQRMVFARAREQFARGQYLTCLDNLRSLPESAAANHPELILFQAMAAQAVGEIGPARRSLESIPPGHATYAQARVLLADLALRAGKPQDVLDRVTEALGDDGASAGPHAHYLAWQAQRQLGLTDEAETSRRTLAREYPRSVEAAWANEARTSVISPVEPGDRIEEVEAPEHRSDFALQLGAFRDRALALRLAAERRAAAPNLRVERDITASPPWYRVVAGSFPTRSQAETALARLRERGLDAVLLVPGRSSP